MGKLFKVLAVATAAGVAGSGAAAQGGGPQAVYWVSAETRSGLGAGGSTAALSQALGGGAGPAGAAPGTPASLAGMLGMAGLNLPGASGAPGAADVAAMAAQGGVQAMLGGSRSGVVANAVGGALGGMLAGGFGGFGRKKPAAPKTAAAAPAPAPARADFSRSLALDLGSSRSAASPAADHLPPAVLKAGNALPLVTPQPVSRDGSGSIGRNIQPQEVKGRMLIYWGCGANAPAPVVVDFASVMKGKAPNLPTITANAGQPPSAGRHATYGGWPNERARVEVPADGSLVGDHVVRGNYAPEIRFTLGAGQDFMAPLRVTQTDGGAGAVKLDWTTIPGATGYFAHLIGSEGDDLVFWSSSGVPASMSNLMDWLPPSEVRRLVASKAVMPATQTTCTVPSQVMKAASGGMLQMIAYGADADFAYPPKPADPKIRWTPEWTAKVRHKSTTTLMLGSESAAD